MVLSLVLTYSVFYTVHLSDHQKTMKKSPYKKHK